MVGQRLGVLARHSLGEGRSINVGVETSCDAENAPDGVFVRAPNLNFVTVGVSDDGPRGRICHHPQICDVVVSADKNIRQINPSPHHHLF
jgi:hypothetical protein